MTGIKTIGLVGGGVIGAGWAARFLLNGFDVTVFDPDPDIARKLNEVTANARRAQAKLMSGLALPEGTLRVAASIDAAVRDADFVVESLPEIEALKIKVLAEIDAAARPGVVIASSTSGLLPTRLQSGMAHPERLVVGHPFNPVYLLPLVEICGGEKTAQATKDIAAALYERIGMRPLHVRKEIDGFIADRLLEALWREALWLVNDGIATTEEIDDAVRYGAGLRWSFMGTFLIYRLAGGEAGMRHFLAQFGPALKLPWTKLDAPELTQELIDTVSNQSDQQAGGVSIRDLERKRDDCLVSVLGALRAQDFAAGAVVKAHEARIMSLLGPAEIKAETDDSAPLRLWRGRVLPEWIDYNGHMTESRYLQCCAEASDALLRRIGVDAAYLASGRSFFTVETHLMHLGQAKLDEALRVDTQVLGGDAKRLHVFHRLSRDGTVIATAEQMLLHVDTDAERAIAADGAVLAAVDHLIRAHAALPRPDSAGRAVGAKR
ncbi:carnitine 3-dehydrogenase [Lichenihabitans psoromatis]|uniref:carnitine 3-dehydrogenase n=1 Tax=Lichenihabitans psoromatis TaxID=2528642 RepID=UPI0010358483|nr:carnitine 3-dehydrogenase [Lichenihabitans psoromatis]